MNTQSIKATLQSNERAQDLRTYFLDNLKGKDFDRRSHGNSSPHYHIPDFILQIGDVSDIKEHIVKQSDYKNLPRAVVGYSMGGAEAVFHTNVAKNDLEYARPHRYGNTYHAWPSSNIKRSSRNQRRRLSPYFHFFKDASLNKN